MSYMSSIWGIANQLMLNKVRVLQNSALKILMNKNRLSPTKELYITSCILPLDIVVKTQLTKIIYNHVYRKKVLNSSIVANSCIHSHNTRTAANLQLPIVKSTYFGLKTSYYKALVTFNSIPIPMRSVFTLSFKTQVKNYLFSQYYTK